MGSCEFEPFMSVNLNETEVIRKDLWSLQAWGSTLVGSDLGVTPGLGVE